MKQKILVRVGIKKKHCFVKKKLIITFNVLQHFIKFISFLVKFCSFVVQRHSFNSRQIDRQILSMLTVLKSYFGKKNL